MNGVTPPRTPRRHVRWADIEPGAPNPTETARLRLAQDDTIVAHLKTRLVQNIDDALNSRTVLLEVIDKQNNSYDNNILDDIIEPIQAFITSLQGISNERLIEIRDIINDYRYNQPIIIDPVARRLNVLVGGIVRYCHEALLEDEDDTRVLLMSPRFANWLDNTITDISQVVLNQGQPAVGLQAIPRGFFELVNDDFLEQLPELNLEAAPRQGLPAEADQELLEFAREPEEHH